MPRIIFKCPHIKGGTKRAVTYLGNLVRYVATREGVEHIGAPTRAQRSGSRGERSRSEMSEFSPQGGNEGYGACGDVHRENYMGYIAQRVGSHGLFTSGDEPLALSKVMQEVAEHPGTVWLPIISLRREDAERLGYNSVENWKALLTARAPELAKAMKIPLDQFRWYAAFHDKDDHPHVHMVCYSADGRSGFLTERGIEQIKSGLAKEIFRQELTEIYQWQTQRRDELTAQSREALRQVVAQMQSGTLENAHLEQIMNELSVRLKSTKGKKQYGYLSPSLKSMVDEIADELAKDPRVAEGYDLWYQLREDVLRTYKAGSPPEPSVSGSGGERRSSGMSEPCRKRQGEGYEACDDALPERLPLSQQKEFRQIKNIIVQEAVRMGQSPLTSVAYAAAPIHPDHSASERMASSAARLFQRVGRLFQDQTPNQSDSIRFVDSKLRRKIQEKKIAMGHKADDHEEQALQ